MYSMEFDLTTNHSGVVNRDVRLTVTRGGFRIETIENTNSCIEGMVLTIRTGLYSGLSDFRFGIYPVLTLQQYFWFPTECHVIRGGNSVDL